MGVETDWDLVYDLAQDLVQLKKKKVGVNAWRRGEESH
jgi:hypothetical protein